MHLENLTFVKNTAIIFIVSLRENSAAVIRLPRYRGVEQWQLVSLII